MIEVNSFDIMLIGLKKPGDAGTSRYANAMARLTGRSSVEFQRPSPSFGRPIFSALDLDTAKVVASALLDAGALIEVRPSGEYSRDTRDQVVATETCPSCGFVQPVGASDCSKCGLVFSKFEREQVQQMRTGRGLEEALTKALKSREEWAQRAKQYLEDHPLAPDAVAGFESSVAQGEQAFLRLDSDEGSILMTSRRLLATRKGEVISIPYEMVEDVDVGGGLVQKKKRVRLVLSFHSPLPAEGGTAKSLTWQLDKESSFYADVVMDWCFARNFICGVCGAREVDYRTDETTPHARCMHCATDHEVDIDEAIAIPRTME